MYYKEVHICIYITVPFNIHNLELPARLSVERNSPRHVAGVGKLPRTFRNCGDVPSHVCRGFCLLLPVEIFTTLFRVPHNQAREMEEAAVGLVLASNLVWWCGGEEWGVVWGGEVEASRVI